MTTRSLLALLSIVPLVAMAEQTEVFEARITDATPFAYESATVQQPMIVEAETLDGQCKFQIGLVGLQGGEGADGGGGLTGRVERTKCFADVAISWSTVAALADGSNGQAVLNRNVFVTLTRR